MHNEKNPTISVNGSPTKYTFGDSFWYITTDEENPFKLKPCQSHSELREIQIGKDGKIYYCFGNRATYNGDFFVKLSESNEENAYYGKFWSEQEAQTWIDKNIPKKLLFSEKTDVYVVYVDRSPCIEKVSVKGLVITHDICEDVPVRIRYALNDLRGSSMDPEEIITEKPKLTIEEIKRGEFGIKPIFDKLVFTSLEVAKDCFPKARIK